eukprot:12668992-Alexandrium_andersonii.AAC.1
MRVGFIDAPQVSGRRESLWPQVLTVSVPGLGMMKALAEPSRRWIWVLGLMIGLWQDDSASNT